MNILIFKTVNGKRMETLLKKIGVLHDDFYIVIPKEEMIQYKKSNSNIHYIYTDKKYMDYHTLMKEARIPNIKFHEIWVLSSAYKYLYNFYEVYAVISELKYSKLKYVVINDGELEMYDLKKETIFSRKYELMIDVIEMGIHLKKALKDCFRKYVLGG